MFVHGWLDQHHRLHVTKLTRPDLAHVFRDGELITIETGQRLAAWAKGDEFQSAAVPVQRPAPEAAPAQQQPPHAPAGAAPSFETFEDMTAAAREAAQLGEREFKAFYKKRTPSEKAALNAMGDELRGLMPAE
jgi:hypothetical protein